MTEPARYVHIVDDVPELDALEQGPVLVHSLDGFLDAGNAAALATQALLSTSRRDGWSPASTSTRSTTTAPGARR